MYTCSVVQNDIGILMYLYCCTEWYINQNRQFYQFIFSSNKIGCNWIKTTEWYITHTVSDVCVDNVSLRLHWLAVKYGWQTSYMYECKRYIQIAKDRTFLVLPLPPPVWRRINVDVVSRYHRKPRTFFFT